MFCCLHRTLLQQCAWSVGSDWHTCVRIINNDSTCLSVTLCCYSSSNNGVFVSFSLVIQRTKKKQILRTYENRKYIFQIHTGSTKIYESIIFHLIILFILFSVYFFLLDTICRCCDPRMPVGDPLYAPVDQVVPFLCCVYIICESRIRQNEMISRAVGWCRAHRSIVLRCP